MALFLTVEMSAQTETNLMNKKSYTCSNCGKPGHTLRACQEPVTSYGVIAFRIIGGGHVEGVLCSDREDYLGLSRAGKIQFLLIQRKDSLSFVEFVRGKYTLEDPTYLRLLLENMTVTERGKLLTMDFDDLWRSVWGEIPTKTYKNDYETSKVKFGILMGGPNPEAIELERQVGITLRQLLEETVSQHAEPEWGFPKGRRNPNEEDLGVAVREFYEETGIPRSQVNIIKNLGALEETFFGSNRVHYCHKYFMGYCRPDLEVGMDKCNHHMLREIGNIGWFSLEEALQKIRPENVEKREVLLRAQGILRNFMPINTQYFQTSLSSI
jgi:8-oxo-dGTP pyrophosphatase MutT (NUDIX family)